MAKVHREHSGRERTDTVGVQCSPERTAYDAKPRVRHDRKPPPRRPRHSPKRKSDAEETHGARTSAGAACLPMTARDARRHSKFRRQTTSCHTSVRNVGARRAAGQSLQANTTHCSFDRYCVTGRRSPLVERSMLLFPGVR